MSLQRARDAVASGDWETGYGLLMDADADGLLGPADLPLLAEAAYAAGHLDVTIDAWERAYARSVDADDPVAAAAAAVRVAMHLFLDTALMAPVRGWLARAERLLEGQQETPAHAWLAVVRTYERMLTGDIQGARQWSERAIAVGSHCDAAACAVGRVAAARLRILDGDVAEGLALLDEVGVAAVSGDLDPLSTGLVYCELVCALQGLAQYDAAEEWTDAMERWCRTNAIGSLHGRCRVHRAEILRLRGKCDDAEQEALVACEELRPYLRREMGWPLSELGRIRLRKGDLDGAEEALRAAHRIGWEPQPGLALVSLARGDVVVAATAIRDALEHPSSVPSKERPPDTELQRAPLLEAQVEIEIAGGDLERARAAAGELERVADRFQSKALVAGATLARRRAGSGTALLGGRTTVERDRGAIRGGDRSDGPRRGPSRRWEQGARRARARRGPDGPRPHRSRGTCNRRDQRPPARGRLLVGGLRGTDGARPRPQGHALSRAVGRPSRTGVPRAGPGRCRDGAADAGGRCGRGARRAGQACLPAPPRRDRGRCRAGARPRGQRAGGAGRRRARVPDSRARARGGPEWSR